MSINRHEFIQTVVSDLTMAMKDTLDAATRTCLNCKYFDEANEVCRFNSVNLRPPARVIATGCPQYSDIQKDLPF